MKKIIIVGAGASGVYLSILLKQKNPDFQVIVLEQNQTSLKKLLASGNGRCNLSHKGIDIACYESDNLLLVDEIVHQFDMVEAMEELGLHCVYQGDLLYPRSEQALSVKRILMNQAEQLGVLFFYEQEVYQIDYQQQYMIYTKNKTYKADDVVLAMGSEAGKLSGVHSSRYDILKKLKLEMKEPTPSLTQMYTQPVMKTWKGVRVKGRFTLYEDQKQIRQEKGEILFTDYGVSGIAVMQLSSLIQKNHQYEIAIDFLDEFDTKKLSEYIALRMNKDYNHFYDGLVHQKIASYFENLGNLSVQQRVSLLKDFRLKITGLRSFETAQVMKGGLCVHEVDSSLQLKKYPHMYAMGEILNVAGLCGGYNLHFAFACASCVAKAIEKESYAKNS